MLVERASDSGGAAVAPVASSAAVVDGYSCFHSGMATLPGGFGLPRKLFDSLYAYQREGVAWMWSLHADSGVPAGSLGRGATTAAPAAPLPPTATGGKICGGILADDMGLGAWRKGSGV